MSGGDGTACAKAHVARAGEEGQMVRGDAEKSGAESPRVRRLGRGLGVT